VLIAQSRGAVLAGPHRARRRWVLVLSLVCAGLLVSGCLGSAFSYVSHRSPDGSILYFKLPSNWKVYDTKQVVSSGNGPLGPSEVKQLADGAWLEAASGAPQPSLGAAMTIGRRWPTATIFAKPLTPTSEDTLSYRTMRAAILGTDPLTTTKGFQVLSYAPFVSTDGVRGVKLVVNITSVKPTRTFGEVVEADRQGAWEFAIGIGCQVSCWGVNSGTIRQILSSWTVTQAP
jgi:hypothetical protein